MLPGNVDAETCSEEIYGLITPAGLQLRVFSDPGTVRPKTDQPRCGKKPFRVLLGVERLGPLPQ